MAGGRHGPRQSRRTLEIEMPREPGQDAHAGRRFPDYHGSSDGAIVAAHALHHHQPRESGRAEPEGGHGKSERGGSGGCEYSQLVSTARSVMQDETAGEPEEPTPQIDGDEPVPPFVSESHRLGSDQEQLASASRCGSPESSWCSMVITARTQRSPVRLAAPSRWRWSGWRAGCRRRDRDRSPTSWRHRR